MNITEKQKQIWDDWIATRPSVIQEMVSKYNLRPDNVYRIKGGGEERCMIHSLFENGALSVNITAELNQDNPLFTFERNVINVKPEDLIEADFPFEAVDGSLYEDLVDE